MPLGASWRPSRPSRLGGKVPASAAEDGSGLATELPDGRTRRTTAPRLGAQKENGPVPKHRADSYLPRFVGQPAPASPLALALAFTDTLIDTLASA
jgi:hypothetical protein